MGTALLPCVTVYDWMSVSINDLHAGRADVLSTHMISMGSLLNASVPRSSSASAATVGAVSRGSSTGAYMPKSWDWHIVAANGINAVARMPAKGLLWLFLARIFACSISRMLRGLFSSPY